MQLIAINHLTALIIIIFIISFYNNNIIENCYFFFFFLRFNLFELWNSIQGYDVITLIIGDVA